MRRGRAVKFCKAQVCLLLTAYFSYGMNAQHSIAFELRLVEPLVSGCVMRKSLMGYGVVVNVSRLIFPVERRFDVNQISVFRRLCFLGAIFEVSHLIYRTVSYPTNRAAASIFLVTAREY